ncbi:hypothetical protein [Xanthomarina gelatinilytica]|uniref:hypothetical protein n=1 Tax=Xanthomarina gelatinilytica TaxID=1137281 RepID=UPI003A896A36
MILLIISVSILSSCNFANKQDKTEQSTQTTSQQESTSEEEYIDDDYTGDDENRSYKLGTITFAVEGNIHTVTQFGIDPYTVMMWFTPESDVDPMAGVVFKSDDFKTSSMVNFNDFDGMQTNYNGQKPIKDGQSIVSFAVDDVTYIFSEGTITIDDFSRKTGKVKLKVDGKANKSVWGKPAEMKMDIPATLEIDAYMPFSNVDGMTHKTEAADKFNVQKP